MALFRFENLRLWTCSQLVILGNDCRLERERAVHAEDLLLQSQAAFEQQRQVLST